MQSSGNPSFVARFVHCTVVGGSAVVAVIGSVVTDAPRGF